MFSSIRLLNQNNRTIDDFQNNNLLYSSADFGMDDRDMMREASTFEEDIMHGATASNLLLEAEPGPATLPDKSNHMEYDDFGDGSLGNTDGGMLGEQFDLFQ